MKWTTNGLKRLLGEIRAQPGYGSRTDLDQCPATTPTILRRARLLGRRNLDTLLLGDDDLLAIVLARTGARKRIVVLDADDVLLNCMEHLGKTDSIEFKMHDLRKGLPRSLREGFDEVFTDPPYTLAGQLMFIHRGLLALRQAGAVSLYVCASRLYLSPSDLAATDGFLKHAGFRLEALYPAFNRYKAPPDVRSDLEGLGVSRTHFDSDLFHYVRYRRAKVPPLPKLVKGNIYSYRGSTPMYVHLMVECKGCPPELMEQRSTISQTLHAAAKACSLHVLEESIHRFLPYGFTGYLLLRESHISIHTWPEHQFALLDIVSCAKIDSGKLAIRLKRILRPSQISINGSAESRH